MTGAPKHRLHSQRDEEGFVVCTCSCGWTVRGDTSGPTKRLAQAHLLSVPRPKKMTGPGESRYGNDEPADPPLHRMHNHRSEPA